MTLDDAIVMMAVVKTQNGEFRNEVIRKNGDLKSVRELAKAYEVARESKEVIDSQRKSAPKPEYEGEVRKVSGPGRYSMRSRGQAPANLPTQHSCTGCGSAPHVKPEVCIARGKRCLRCGVFNNFARVCPNKKNGVDRQVRALASALEQGSNAGDPNESVYLYQVTKMGSPSPTAVVEINGKPLKLHLDTQADVTVITESHFAELEGVSKLQATSVKVRGFSGDGKGPTLPLKGCFWATLGHRDKSFNETVYVVQGQGSTALLSRQANEGLGLVEYHIDQLQKSVQPIMGEESQAVHDMVQEYQDVFQGIGKLKNVTVKLQVDPAAKGVIQKQRRVSIPLKDKFDQILERWEELDIIEDVGDEPTEWCSNVVLTPKKDGESVRASLDMTDANKYIMRTRHAIPTLRELETKLNGAKYFSHLDMNDGYMQLELAEESRKLTTFYTHRGLKRFKRLHFGVNSAAEIFNEEVRKIVQHEPNAISIYDDILVFGPTQEEHDKALRHVLELWRQHSLTLSIKKSRFNLRSVKFFGKVFSEKGISPDPDKVAALHAAGPPNTAAEVRSFLFFAGASADFISGFAQITAPLRELIKDGTQFHWTPEHQQAFEQTKTMMSSDTSMAYFDPSRKTKLKTDAGPKGIAVTLKQLDPESGHWRPVTYRSRALTDTEQRYSQLEKEAKAVEWGVFINQIYLYGLREAFDIDTDHKPLVPLFMGHKSTAPIRIERMRVRLQGFNYRLNYVAGKKAGMESNEADYTSRHPEPMTATAKGEHDKPEFELREMEEVFEQDIRAVVKCSLPDALTWDEILQGTMNDPELTAVKEAITRGYLTTDDKKRWGHKFDPVFTELAVVGGLVVRGARIVVPTALQERVVRLAHEGHQGITKTKEYLRARVWFPGLDRIVEERVRHCHPCQVVTVAQDREPLRMSKIPSEPWKEIAIDFWGPVKTGEYLLVMVCKHSRWVEVEFVSSTSARAVIPKLDRVFSSMGIPAVVGSDNGPPFNGQEFVDFSKYMGFVHELKTPKNPQANAEAEQFMRILKKLYQICHITGQTFKQEVHRFLRCYRATPHSTTKAAPAERIFPNRKFRTRLPSAITPVQMDFEEIFQRDYEKKMQMKRYADDRRYVKTSDLQVGDSVLVRQEQPNKATPPYEEDPLTVVYRKGSQVVGKRVDGSTITRTTAHFKPVPYQSIDEVNDWELGGQSGTAVACDKGTSEQSEQSEAADAPLTTTLLGMPRALLSGQAQEARNSVGRTADSPEIEGVRRSERQRKSTKEHLQAKYPDFEFQLTESKGGM